MTELLEVGRTLPSHVQQAWDALNGALQRAGLEVWPRIVNKAKRYVRQALDLLNESKDQVVSVCHRNRELIQTLTKLGIKSVAKVAASEVLVKQGANLAVRNASKALLKGAALPPLAVVQVVPDVAQVGLELCGWKEAGKQVGKYGNVASGAIVGGAIAGPLGIGVGALAGFVIWGAGEVVGNMVERQLTQDP